jgi:hypothetical protein
MTQQERAETLTFIFDALVRINDRQETHSDDTAEDLQDIQNAVERLRGDLSEGA